MSLRAGYYGVKRFLRNKLETIATTYDSTVSGLTADINKRAYGLHIDTPVGDAVTKTIKPSIRYQRILVFVYASTWEAVILLQPKYHANRVDEYNIFTTDDTKNLSPVYNDTKELISFTLTAQGQYDFISVNSIDFVTTRGKTIIQETEDVVKSGDSEIIEEKTITKKTRKSTAKVKNTEEE